MSVPRIAVVVCLAVLTVAAPAQAQSPPRDAVMPSESVLNRLALTRRWWGHAIVNSLRDRVVNLTVDETHLFVQSSAGVVTAFDSETGKQLWASKVGMGDRAVQPPYSEGGFLYVVNGLRMYAVRKDSGNIEWELNLPSIPSSSPSADDQHLYIGFLDGSLYAFDLEMIDKLYKEGKLPQFSSRTVKWRFRTSNPMVTPALTDGSLVSFASGNGSLYTVAAEDRTLMFQFETDAPVSAPLVRYKDQLLVASEDSDFYSINATSGRSLWQLTTGTVIRKAPVLIGDEVFLLPDEGRLFRLSAEHGNELWPRARPKVRTFLSATADRVFVVDYKNFLQVLNRHSGELLGDLRLDRFTQHLTNDRSDRIYVATAGGLVMCLHELGRDFPRFHRHPERQPVLPEFAPDGYDQTVEEVSAPPEAQNP